MATTAPASSGALRLTGRVALVAFTTLAFPRTSSAQSDGRAHTPGEDGYFRAVAGHFGVPRAEVDILRDWGLPAQEVPVVLFVAERAGVSPEALIAVWREGSSLEEILARYEVGVTALHFPLPEDAAAGVLERVYEALRATPVAEWDEVKLTANEAVAFVNLRMLIDIAGAGPVDILRLADEHEDFVDVYTELVSRNRSPLGLGTACR